MEVEGMEEGGYAVFDSTMGVQEERGKSSTTAYLVKVGPLVCVLVPFLVGVAVGWSAKDCADGGAVPQTSGGIMAPGIAEPTACPTCPACSGADAAEGEAVPLSEIQQVSVDANGGDRSQYEGQVVLVEGLVEAVHNNGFFIMDDSDFGLYVYVDPYDPEHPWPTADDGTTVREGDQVELQGEILEYYGVTELTRLDPDVSRIVSRGNELPAPFELGPNALSEEHEGVMVAVQGDCIYHDLGHGEWGIRVSGTEDTVILIDDMLDPDAAPEYNRQYYVEGVGHFSFGQFKVEATLVEDIGEGTLVGPEGEYVAPPPPPPSSSPPPPSSSSSSSPPPPLRPPSGTGQPCVEVPTVTLSEIQAVSVDAEGNDHSPYEGQVVKVDALVLAVAANGFFIQDNSDFGLWVYIDSDLGDNFGWPTTAAGRPVESGDRVELQGEIMEYRGVTELTRVEVDHSRIISHGNALPMPFTLHTHELSEEHEGVLVSVQGVCTFHDIGHGEWVLNDGELEGSMGVIIDDMLDPEATPEYNRRYRVEGIGHFSYGQYKVEATSVTDLGPGRLVGPEGEYSAEPPPPPACTAGSQSVAEGCVECTAGFADTDADPFTPCQRCPVGTYADTGATECTDCSSMGMYDDDMDPSTACAEEQVCQQVCPAGFEDSDCDATTACSACPPHSWTEGGTFQAAPCTACGKHCPPPPPPLPPPPPPPPTCDRVMQELGPSHSRHNWRTLPALPCLEVPPCSGGRSVFAELEYIVQDGLDHPRGAGQRWPLPDDFNVEDAVEPTSAELCWIEGAGGQELKIRWESSDAAAELSTQTGCRDPVWQQDSLELYLSLGLADPQTYLELDIAPAGGFFGGLIHNPSGRSGNDAFPLGVDYDPANPWMVEGVDCADLEVQRMMAGVHWNVTRHQPTVDDLSTVRADLTVPMSALRGRGRGDSESFGALDGQSGVGGQPWVSEWYDNANTVPDGRVMRANFYHYQNGWQSHGPKHVAHVCSGWSKTDCDGVTPETDGSWCNEQHIPYSFGVLVLVE